MNDSFGTFLERAWLQWLISIDCFFDVVSIAGRVDDLPDLPRIARELCYLDPPAFPAHDALWHLLPRSFPLLDITEVHSGSLVKQCAVAASSILGDFHLLEGCLGETKGPSPR